MKRLIYQPYIGKQSKLYDWCTESVARYCGERGYTHVVETEPILKIKPDIKNPRCNRSKESYEKHGGFLPIFEKSVALGLLDVYDEVAILDADIWVRPGSPCLFEAAGDGVDFGGVLERDMPSTREHVRKIQGYGRLFKPLMDVNWDVKQGVPAFYNMGLMVMKNKFKDFLDGQSPEEFLRRPEFKRFVDGENNWKWSTDQVLYNWFVKKMEKERGMELGQMDWRWNCLFSAVPLPLPTDAHFVHFFLKDRLPGGGENVKALERQVV